MLTQSFKMAWKAILSNKMRSFLTMLGIIIGVVALVVLVSLTRGATQSVTDQISELGSNLISVTISDDKGKPFKLDDLSLFTDADEIAAVAPIAQSSVTAGDGDDSETATAYGTTASYQDIQGLTLGSGRFLKGVDVENHSNVAVVSANLAEDVLGSTDVVGQSIKLNGISYLVVGVLEGDDDSSTLASSFRSYEIYLPYSSLVRLSDSVSVNITSFCVSAASEDSMDAAQTAVETILLNRFNSDENAFTIMNQSAIMEALETVTGILSLLLGGIAGISLLVGGIGIMNIMLVSVTERTREIGIRKSIGASRKAIMAQFLIEAMILSLMGCLIGIALSWVILQIASQLASSYNLHFTLSMGVVWFSIIFSTLIGVVFGLYPANKAAKKNPIEALRFQ